MCFMHPLHRAEPHPWGCGCEYTQARPGQASLWELVLGRMTILDQFLGWWV